MFWELKHNDIYVHYLTICNILFVDYFKKTAFIVHLRGRKRKLRYIMVYGKNASAVHFKDLRYLKYNEIGMDYWVAEQK